MPVVYFQYSPLYKSIIILLFLLSSAIIPKLLTTELVIHSLDTANNAEKKFWIVQTSRVFAETVTYSACDADKLQLL